MINTYHNSNGFFIFFPDSTTEEDKRYLISQVWIILRRYKGLQEKNLYTVRGLITSMYGAATFEMNEIGWYCTGLYLTAEPLLQDILDKTTEKHNLSASVKRSEFVNGSNGYQL